MVHVLAGAHCQTVVGAVRKCGWCAFAVGIGCGHWFAWLMWTGAAMREQQAAMLLAAAWGLLGFIVLMVTA